MLLITGKNQYNIAKMEDFHKVPIENKQNFKFTLNSIKTQARFLFETMVL